MTKRSKNPPEMTAFRLRPEMLARLDALAAKMAKESGVPVTRAGVVRMLLNRGLDDVERTKVGK